MRHIRSPFVALLFAVALVGVARGADIVPLQGNWLVVGEPGSGVLVEAQDGVTSAIVFTYDQQTLEDRWFVAVGVLNDGVLEAPLTEFEGGSCIECEPYEPPETLASSRVLRIEFVGSTQGWLSIDQSNPKPIRPLVFWSPAAQPLSHIDEWGQAFVPDLSGIWLFTSVDSKGDANTVRVSFDAILIIDDPPGGHVAFLGSDGHRFTCYSHHSEYLTPVCVLEETSKTPVMSAHISDVGIGRIQGYAGPPVPIDSPDIRGESPWVGVRVTEPNSCERAELFCFPDN